MCPFTHLLRKTMEKQCNGMQNHFLLEWPLNTVQDVFCFSYYIYYYSVLLSLSLSRLRTAEKKTTNNRITTTNKNPAQTTSNRLEVSFAKFAVCGKHWMICLFTGPSDYNMLMMFTFSSAGRDYNKRLPIGETNKQRTHRSLCNIIKCSKLSLC